MDWKDSAMIFLRTVQKETTLYEIREALELGPARVPSDQELAPWLVEMGWDRWQNRHLRTVWRRRDWTKPAYSDRIDKGLNRNKGLADARR